MIFNGLNSTHNNRLFWGLVFTTHVILLFILHQSFGFNYSNEGGKYLAQAKDLADFNTAFSFKYSSFYTFYVLYLSFFLYFKLPLVLIFFCTYCFSLYAYYRFYQFLQLSISFITARIWLVCMLLSPFIQYWQFNLFSETFFIALSLLYVSVVLSPQQKHRSLKIVLLSIAILFSRPNGIFVVLITLVFYVYKQRLLSPKKIVYLCISLCIVLLAGIIFLMPLPYKDFTFQLTSGAIYCGFPTLSYTTLPEGNYTLWNCYGYIYQTHGLQTLLSLFVKKSISFFSLTRPYYSLFHNVVNNMHVVFYVLGLIGLYKAYRQQQTWYKLLMAFMVLVLLNALMVGLIYNEWSERHTLQVFPFILVGSSFALSLFKIKVCN